MKLKALAMAAMVGLGTLPMALQAAEVPEGPHVVTSGTASVDATPDIATLAIEVSVSSKDAAQAKKQVDERVAQYFDFLQKNNIEKKDISAANLRTQPEYDYLKTGESVLKGYRAVRQVQVTLRQLDKLNELLDGALKSGLNGSVRWSWASPSRTCIANRHGKSDRERDSTGRIPGQRLPRQAGAGVQHSLSGRQLPADAGGADV